LQAALHMQSLVLLLVPLIEVCQTALQTSVRLAACHAAGSPLGATAVAAAAGADAVCCVLWQMPLGPRCAQQQQQQQALLPLPQHS
jgi:hypothetical protein